MLIEKGKPLLTLLCKNNIHFVTSALRYKYGLNSLASQGTRKSTCLELKNVVCTCWDHELSSTYGRFLTMGGAC